MRHLPAAPPPPAIAIQAGDTAPPAGHGRLVVDVVDGQGPAYEIKMRAEPAAGAQRVTFRFREEPMLVCAKPPCVLDLPLGNVILGFPVVGRPGELEAELLHIEPAPSVYRRALSVYKDRRGGLHTLGIVGASVGSASAITGIALLPIGLAGGSDGLTISGGVTLGVGAALVTFGILAMRHDAATFRPGSASRYLLQEAPQR